MRTATWVLALSAAVGLLAPVHAQKAERAPSSSYKGIWVSTPYPAFHAPAGETVTLDLNVHNAGSPPQAVGLQLERVPGGWSGEFLGEGKRVQSVFVAADEKANVKLRLEPSGDVAGGTHRFDVVATGADSKFKLPVQLTIGQSPPARLSLKPELPELRGSPSTDFDFKVAVRNDGGEDATVRFDVQAPEGFRTKVSEQFGSQELPSLPLKAGEQKAVSVKITPLSGVKEGKYPALLRATSGKAQAETQVAMEVSGEPRLEVTGQGERLSANAEAGSETAIDVQIANRGSAAAQDVKLQANAPSGWKVAVQPERIDAIAPNETATAKLLVTPSGKAIAGDYMVNVRAIQGGGNKSSDIRVTVRTSTLWGVAGIAVIAAALIVLVAAMLRYGRR